MTFLQRLQGKRLAYLQCFLGADGKLNPAASRVMADLKRFCGINRGGIVVSPISRMVDPYATAYRAGQRDTYLRISKFIGLDETDIQEERSNETSTDG